MDRYLIHATTTDGIRLEHRRSIVPDGDDYWRATDSWNAAFATGSTEDEAIAAFRREVAG